MSDGALIEGRLARERGRTVCVLTGVEARVLARRWPRCTVAEAVRREAARQAEADRRAFVRLLWAQRGQR